MKKLTIGFPCYDDYDGVYFSIQSLRMHHAEALEECELLIVDNNPTSDHGKATKEFADARRIKYVPFSESTGPANTKNKVFEEATTDYVLCADSHVLFEAGSIGKLLAYYNLNPHTPDLLQGPLVYDCLQSVSTHFKEGWSGGMYGKWATDDRGKDPNGEPFEIPMQGMGVFSGSRKKWLKFNKNFHGFGAEEGYIHEKYRQAGHKTLCLPFLRWVHRFGRPSGVKYPLLMEERIRNYLIGHTELNLPLDDLMAHFSELHPHINIDQIIKSLDKPYSPPSPPAPSPLKPSTSPLRAGPGIKLWGTSEIKFPAPTPFRYLEYQVLKSYDNQASLRHIEIEPPLPPEASVQYFSSQTPEGPASSILDDSDSYWLSDSPDLPHKVIIDLGSPTLITKITSMSRQGLHPGLPTEFKVYGSNDLIQWQELSHVDILSS